MSNKLEEEKKFEESEKKDIIELEAEKKMSDSDDELNPEKKEIADSDAEKKAESNDEEKTKEEAEALTEAESKKPYRSFETKEEFSKYMDSKVKNLKADNAKLQQDNKDLLAKLDKLKNAKKIIFVNKVEKNTKHENAENGVA